ncbi:MAG: hypothetical protein NTX19_00840 [Gemmatimonadetes bacterium]|nr:hypothetical protein [Gemmatimonadota bacterium]
MSNFIRWTARLLGVAAIASAPQFVGAQEARLLAIRDDATRDFVRQFVEAARVRGTPTEPLVSRALEGVAFKADRKRIEQAMAALEKRLRRSRDLLGAKATADEVAAGADALAADVPAGMIQEMKKLAPQRQITVELGVLTELVAKGISPKVAAERIKELMARGATGAQLTELNAAVQQDVALGIKPVAALELRGRGVMSLLPPPASVNSAQRR